MKKVVLLVCGASAAVTMVVIGSGHAGADVPDVTGETYGKAVAILKSQGIKPLFGGSIGSDLPQSQCTVVPADHRARRTKMRLMLDCNAARGRGEAAGAQHPFAGTARRFGPREGDRPTPGAGTVTVTPVPIG